MFRVSLETATGGARIIEGNSLATLTIPENDGPFGVVSFGNPASVAMEIGQTGTSVTMIPVLRRSEVIVNNCQFHVALHVLSS